MRNSLSVSVFAVLAAGGLVTGCSSDSGTTPAAVVTGTTWAFTPEAEILPPSATVPSSTPPPGTTTAAGGAVWTNSGDAVTTVRRYLLRWTGNPVQADDTEGRYPLVCAGSTLANNPGRLTGTIGFADDQVKLTQSDGSAVSVPVRNSSGVTTTRTFTVGTGAQGLCLSDVTG